jgi:hyperosmotically inducible periplasmic protein
VKVMYRVTLMVAAVALLAISVPVHASKMDDRIESTARKSYVFKTYLQADDIKIESRDGDVTLYGKASNAAELNLATKFANDVNGVKGVKNRMIIE